MRTPDLKADIKNLPQSELNLVFLGAVLEDAYSGLKGEEQRNLELRDLLRKESYLRASDILGLIK